MSARDDEALLASFVATRSDDAFRAFIERYGSLVFAVCRGELDRDDQAEDAAQAVFLLLAEKAERLRVRGSLVGWLYATSRLVCKAARREERRRMSREVPLDESFASSAPDVARLDVGRALARLSKDQRELVALKVFQGMSYGEAGRVLGIREDAARMRLQRALDRMRPFLAGHGEAGLSALALPPTLLSTTLLSTSEHARALARVTRNLMTTNTVSSVAAVAVSISLATLFALRSGGSPVSVPPVRNGTAAVVSASPGVRTEPPTVPVEPLPPVRALTKPFTLVYRMTITDQRNQAMKDADLAKREKELAADVDADRRSQADADALLAEARKPRETAVKQLTLSYDGHTFLFDEPTSGTKNDWPNLNLFDGEFSYHFTPGVKNIESIRMPGTISYFINHLPYVGSSLPLLPLIEGGKVLDTFAVDTKPVFVEGLIEVARGGAVKHVALGRAPKPPYEIMLADFIKVRGVPVARSIVVTNRDFSPDFEQAPRERIEYKLVSARSAALPPDRFAPENYVVDGDDIAITDVARHSPAHHVKYDHTKGTLQQQIASAKGPAR